FGYAMTPWVDTYDDVEILRAREQVPAEIAIIELPWDTHQIVESFRVVDADPKKPEERYLVRLAANPTVMYAVSCENFLTVFRGNTQTVPVNKAVVARWAENGLTVAGEISCNTLTGKALSWPAAAPQAARA